MTDGPASEAMSVRLELVLTVLMAVAATLTAWAGFQSTKWSGEQADAYASAGADRTESTEFHTEAGQARIVDVIVYNQWLAALNEEIAADPSARPDGQGYQPREGTLSAFLYQRFRAEFRPAFDAWLATRPLVNPQAPATPFVMPEYQLSAQAQAQRLGVLADQKAAQARRANQISDNYVLVAVFFALVLFFAGVAGRTRGHRSQVLLSGMGVITLLAALVALATFPIEI